MRGGFYVETTADLGAARHKVPALQHHDADLLLCREILWPAFQKALRERK